MLYTLHKKWVGSIWLSNSGIFWHRWTKFGFDLVCYEFFFIKFLKMNYGTDMIWFIISKNSVGLIHFWVFVSLENQIETWTTETGGSIEIVIFRLGPFDQPDPEVSKNHKCSN